MLIASFLSCLFPPLSEYFDPELYVKGNMSPNQGHEAPDASWELREEEAVTAEMLVEDEDDAFPEDENHPRMGPEQSMLLLLTQSSWQVCPLSLLLLMSFLFLLLGKELLSLKCISTCEAFDLYCEITGPISGSYEKINLRTLKLLN